MTIVRHPSPRKHIGSQSCRFLYLLMFHGIDGRLCSTHGTEVPSHHSMQHTLANKHV